jgi:glycosyltransferase involved in cell wall biosynthesis
LRQELGIADDEFVILAPGESTRAANHRTAWHAAAILGVLTSKCRLLLWGRGREARSIRELTLRAKLPNLVIDAEHTLARQVPFEHLLPVADAALVTAKPQASLLPIAACAAAGLPIVAIDNPVIREIFGGAVVSRVPPKDVRTLSQRLLELSENPSLRQTMGATAAVAARPKFDPQRFDCDQVALCQRLLAIHPHQPESAQPATSSQPAPAH